MTAQENEHPQRIIGQRYKLVDQIGKGGMGIVSRAYDRLTGQMVALKQVTVDSDRLQFSMANTMSTKTSDMRVSLANEFQLLASLRHPNIISVLDYGFDEEGQPYFTMELLENASTILEYGSKLDTDGRVDLIMQMLQALMYLHRRGVIHRDLKPDNALVVDGVVKLLDFGISLKRDLEHDFADTTSGTLAYMAPEVLTDGAASEASDIYAVGMIFYELVMEKYPFDISDPTRLIEMIVGQRPVFDRVGLPESITHLMERMLMKDANARYQRAGDVIRDYADMTGTPLAMEEDVVESFLQAADFVGRDAEMAKLMKALTHMLMNEGSLWLIGGESGVGKSRLIDELRTQALVRGATVLRGQAVSAGAQLYGLWRPAVRRMLLAGDVSEEDASVIKELVPDIGDLLKSDVPDAPEVTPQQAHERLLDALERLFVGREQPLLILLEDLHWADESFSILKRIQAHVSSNKLLIIGTYRSDERPDVPKVIEGANLILLERFDQNVVTRLSELMLGDVGRKQSIVNWLARESGGNVFFIVEVLRSLLASVGQVENINPKALPDKVMAEGIVNVVRRRIERVPAESLDLLRLTAVLGRQIDLNILKTASEGADLDAWLTTCMNAAVLEVREETWRFTHDRVRDGILVTLPGGDELAAYHKRAAEAIIDTYGELDEHLPALAYHWDKAKDMEKSVHYAVMAGNVAMRGGLSREATRYFGQALAALETLLKDPYISGDAARIADLKRRVIDVTNRYARAAAFQLENDVETRLISAVEMAQSLGDEEREARMLAALGTYYYMHGETRKALPFFGQCIQTAEKLGLEEVLVLPYNIIGRALAVSGNYAPSNGLLAKGIPLAEKFGETDLLAGSLVFYGIGQKITEDVNAGDEEIARGMDITHTEGIADRIASNNVILGMGYLVAMQFDIAEPYLLKALEIAEQEEVTQTIGIATGGLSVINRWKQEPLKSIEYHKRSLDMAKNHGVNIHYVYFNINRAEVELSLDDPITAESIADEMINNYEVKFNPLGIAEAHILKARLRSKEGKFAEAEDHLNTALESHRMGARPAMAANTLFELGKLRCMRGDTDGMRAALDEARREFERLKMTHHQRLLAEFESTLE